MEYICIWSDGSWCELRYLSCQGRHRIDSFKLAKIDLAAAPEIPNLAKMKDIYKTLAEISLLIKD